MTEHATISEGAPPTATQKLANRLPEWEELITKDIGAAKACQAEAFERFVHAGQVLAEAQAEFQAAGAMAKEINEWVTSKLKVSKQWKNRLIRVAINIDRIRPLLADMPRQDHTVDKALAALKKAEAATGARGEGTGVGEGSRSEKLTKADAVKYLTDAVGILVKLMAVETPPQPVVELKDETRKFLEVVAFYGVGADAYLPFDIEQVAIAGVGEDEGKAVRSNFEKKGPAPMSLTKAQINRVRRLLPQLEDDDQDVRDHTLGLITKIAEEDNRTVEEIISSLA